MDCDGEVTSGQSRKSLVRTAHGELAVDCYCVRGSAYLWSGNTSVSGAERRIMDWISFPVILILLYVIVSLRVLKQYERGVVFLLGRFAGVRGPGLTLIFVPFQQMVRVSLRTVSMQIPSQKIITKENVSIHIAAARYYHIPDPETAAIDTGIVHHACIQH